MTRIALAAIAVMTLTACRATAPEGYVSLKDAQPPTKISRPTPKAKAVPAIASVVVVAPSKEIATAIESEMISELGQRGYAVAANGTWRIMGVATENPTAVQWTVINHAGGHVGTVSQSNPSATLLPSATVIASAAAASVVRLLPPSK
jgi:hypothetical protein